jgi:hypothetical protein
MEKKTEPNNHEEAYKMINGMISILNGMYGILDTDYGRGMMQGIFATLRTLGMEEGYRAYLDEIRKEEQK